MTPTNSSKRPGWEHSVTHKDDIVEAHCYVVDNRLFCTQLVKVYVTRTSCYQLLLILLRVYAQDQFAHERIRQLELIVNRMILFFPSVFHWRA